MSSPQLNLKPRAKLFMNPLAWSEIICCLQNKTKKCYLVKKENNQLKSKIVNWDEKFPTICQLHDNLVSTFWVDKGPIPPKKKDYKADFSSVN